MKEKEIVNFLKQFDYITFVPMTKIKEEKRGYNQSKYLAYKIGCNLIIPCVEALTKTKENLIQSKLNRVQRFKNVKDVYLFDNQFDLKGKNIILIDDILTTGATIEECSKELKQNGIKKVCVMVMAKA